MSTSDLNEFERAARLQKGLAKLNEKRDARAAKILEAYQADRCDLIVAHGRDAAELLVAKGLLEPSELAEAFGPGSE